MKKITLTIIITALIFFAVIFLAGCNDDNEDKTKSIDKDGSVDVQLSIIHSTNNTDLLQIQRKVWIGGVIKTTTIGLDTLKSLGVTKEKVEDSDGNETMVTVPKNYQIFITVK